jgi:CheY-like chemotaxis protein
MNGYVTTKSIREIDRPDLKKIPIIALSAHTMDEDRNNSLECGMNGHVSKPLDLQELSKVLAECIPL